MHTHLLSSIIYHESNPISHSGDHSQYFLTDILTHSHVGSFLSDRSTYDRYYTSYRLEFDMVDGRSVWFNNSHVAITSKQIEKTAFKCAAILFTGAEPFYWLQQFSIYIQVKFIESAMVYIERDTNITSRYMATTKTGSIHYTGLYDTDNQHIISLAAPIVQQNTSSIFMSNYYLSITQALNCTNNVKGNLNIFFYTTEFPIDNYTNSIGVGNHMFFNGPCVYFKSMYDIMKIIMIYMPRCDVVVNYILFSSIWKRKHQEECKPGYYKVRL